MEGTTIFLHPNPKDKENKSKGPVANYRYEKKRREKSPVGRPSVKYLSGPGWKSTIFRRTYLAAHSETSLYVSRMIRRIVKNVTQMHLLYQSYLKIRSACIHYV